MRKFVLNDVQQSAVAYQGGPLLVLAGAGSGKTGVITHKISHLLNSGLKPQQIIAVTFTNKAALEMKRRVSKLADGQNIKGLQISTFHSLGLRFIRQHASLLQRKSQFTILDPEDSLNILRDIAGKAAIDLEKAKFFQSQISQWKNNLLTYDQAVQTTENDWQRQASVLYEPYDNALRAYNSVDFDDLIRLPVQLMQSNQVVREQWQNQTRHLLVDEYQDTNLAQYAWVKMLTGSLGNFTVVGDDDQSIYAWRGARADNLVQLQEDYPRLKVIKLEQNYRSTQTILSAANTLITNNPHLFEKKLWSEMGYGDKIHVLACHNEEDEATQVVMNLMQHQRRSGLPFHQYAILYRSNFQSRPFEKVLREHQIPYKITGGQSFFARAEIKDIMAYLRLLINPDNDAAFLRIVNTPKREIGPQTLEKLGHYAQGRNMNLLPASLEIGLSAILPERSLNNVQRFGRWLIELGDRTQRGDALGNIKDMINDIGYEAYLFDTQTTPKAAEVRMENVWELVNWIGRLLEGEDNPTLQDVINKLCLFDMLEQQQEQTPNAVQLMTLHAAKGLEFPHVYLVGVEEKLLPHHNSIDEDNVEEERRLCYVGITRARETLHCSFCQKRMRHGEELSVEPSRFLTELPADCLDWPGKIEKTEEEKKQSAQSHLSALKDLLG
jgi:ATP-dependent DNA helicase Rep